MAISSLVVVVHDKHEEEEREGRDRLKLDRRGGKKINKSVKKPNSGFY